MPTIGMYDSPAPSCQTYLHETLLEVEDELLEVALDCNAASQPSAELISKLSSLMQFVTHGIANKLIDSASLSLTRNIASTMTMALRQVKPRTVEIEKGRQGDLANAFSRFSLNSEGLSTCERNEVPLNAPSAVLKRKRVNGVRANYETASESLSSSSSSFSQESVRLGDGVLPPHIPLAYAWLVDNLHNPYPATAVKARIASASGVSVKCIGDWFSNVRRRIGWSALLKRHFRGERTAMLDAAHAVFGKPGLSDMLNVPQRVVNELLQVERTLKALYANKLEASTFAKMIPTVVASTKGSSRCRKRRRESDGDDSRQIGTCAIPEIDTTESCRKRRRGASSIRSDSEEDEIHFLDGSHTSKRRRVSSTDKEATAVDSSVSDLYPSGPTTPTSSFEFQPQLIMSAAAMLPEVSSSDPELCSQLASSNLLGDLDFSVWGGETLFRDMPDERVEINAYDWSKVDLFSILAPTTSDSVVSTIGGFSVPPQGVAGSFVQPHEPIATNFDENEPTTQLFNQFEGNEQLFPSFSGFDPSSLALSPQFSTFASSAEQLLAPSSDLLPDALEILSFPQPDVEAKKERLRQLREEADLLETDLITSAYTGGL